MQNSTTARSPGLPVCPTCGGHTWRAGTDVEQLLAAELRSAYAAAVELLGRKRADAMVAAIGASPRH